ncbi:hypothetical protein AAFF_G00212470 [Aldrovandia affinis]|uniref:Uncharacterized protein n=1 Tax=Aldrovandia affinis TaxID=143900 RepID=A0AAD7RGZ6_9TELE|nr:hypothetical protein AAFF_G00212470 [Aldrovandia affinis]
MTRPQAANKQALHESVRQVNRSAPVRTWEWNPPSPTQPRRRIKHIAGRPRRVAPEPVRPRACPRHPLPSRARAFSSTRA